MELRRDARALHALGLVHQQHQWTSRLTQLCGDDAVLRSQSGTSVHDEQHKICFIDRLTRLLRHLIQDAFFGDRLQTTGVHHQIRTFADTALAIMAVACQSGLVGHQGITTAREAIEQSGFADVRTTDEYECR